jgi:hypothetical protein
MTKATYLVLNSSRHEYNTSKLVQTTRSQGIGVTLLMEGGQRWQAAVSMTGAVGSGVNCQLKNFLTSACLNVRCTAQEAKMWCYVFTCVLRV